MGSYWDPRRDRVFILSFLPITELHKIQSVCRQWKTSSMILLNDHHSKFTSRVKLYATILAYSIEQDREKGEFNFDDDEPILCCDLWKTESNDPIFEKYGYMYMDDDELWEESNKEERQNSIMEYLEGERYEYPYDGEDEDFKVKCAVCKNNGFLPVMVRYTATRKNQRTESSYIFLDMGLFVENV